MDQVRDMAVPRSGCGNEGRSARRYARDGGLPAGIALALALASLCAHAADTSIGVSADVYTESCTVSAGSDLQIDFGNVDVVTMQESGTASDWVNAPRTIEVSCPPDMRTVWVRFDGVADPGYPDNFKNEGTAKNVTVELQMQGGIMIGPGLAHELPLVSGRAEYALRARVYSRYGAAEAGTVLVPASFTIVYY